MTIGIVQADAGRLPFPDATFDACIGSPPYADARLYLEDGRNLGISRGADEWVEWMLRVTAECLRVTKGPVIWIAAGVTRDWNYWPVCERLMSEWNRGVPGSGVWQDGIELPLLPPHYCHAFRPCYWHRVGIPGSGGKQWYRADVEYAMCFKRPGKLPYADPTANGHPPKWGPGGEMSHRVQDGDRRNQWGKHMNSRNSQRKTDGTFQGGYRPSHRAHTKRDANGEMRDQEYVPPALANPGNLLKTTVGGGQMGHSLAHENEAPFPVAIPAFFIRSHCPKFGKVLDPFGGSGSTAQAAVENGREAVVCDLRRSQCNLAKRRLGTVNRGFAFT